MSKPARQSLAAGVDGIEEFSNRSTGVLTSVEPAPDRTQTAGKLIAGVDWYEETSRVAVRVGRPDQQGLNIVGKHLEFRIGGQHLRPGLQSEFGLRDAGRTRVERDGPAQHRAGEEENQPDGNVQPVPAGLGQAEVRKGQVPIGHRLVAQVGILCREQQPAASANTHQLPGVDTDHVRMIVADRLGAHIAGLEIRVRRRTGGDPAQHRHRPVHPGIEAGGHGAPFTRPSAPRR